MSKLIGSKPDMYSYLLITSYKYGLMTMWVPAINLICFKASVIKVDPDLRTYIPYSAKL